MTTEAANYWAWAVIGWCGVSFLTVVVTYEGHSLGFVLVYIGFWIKQYTKL